MQIIKSENYKEIYPKMSAEELGEIIQRLENDVICK